MAGIVLSGSDVLAIIDPVDPENLAHMGNGIYRAMWCPPIPCLDVELLQHTKRVQIEKQAYEPAWLPGWLAVHFTITG